ncbi:MAG: VOC family protein [Pseudomonadales bacterium]|nr:VOC family protein [Pseudomonadales bacterium]
MNILSLGHVVVRVKDLARSEAFYKDVLGLESCAHYNQDGLKMAFYSLCDHHDFAISQSAELGDATASGLDHVAFKIGDCLDDLLAAKRRMDAHGVEVQPVDHIVTKSIYLADPDGNGIELYVDTSDAWRDDPNLIANARPMEL